MPERFISQEPTINEPSNLFPEESSKKKAAAIEFNLKNPEFSKLL